MPILNKPTIQMAEEMNGIEYDCYAYTKPLKKNQLYELSCDVDHITSTSSVQIGLNDNQDKFLLWCKLDESRVLLLTFEQASMGFYVYGQVMVVNEDVATRKTTPFLYATEEDATELSQVVKFFSTDTTSICKVKHQGSEFVVFKSSNYFYLVEILDNGVGGTSIEPIVAYPYEYDIQEYQGEIYPTSRADEFVFFYFNEKLGDLAIYQCEFTEDYNLITTMANESVSSGLIKHKLLKVAKLDDDDNYCVIFSNTVLDTSTSTSLSGLAFYYLHIDVVKHTITSTLIDNIALTQQYTSLSCDYRDGYITVLGQLKAFNNTNLYTFIYFIQDSNNIVEMYHKNRIIKQSKEFTNMQGAMVCNNGLFYAVYNSSTGLAGSNVIGMQQMDVTGKSLSSISMANKVMLYNANPPIIFNNNIYFLFGDIMSRYMNSCCYAFFIEPTAKPFLPYSNLFGISEENTPQYNPDLPDDQLDPNNPDFKPKPEYVGTLLYPTPKQQA